MVVLCMLDMKRAIAGTAKIAMVSLRRREVRANRWSCIVSSNVVKASQETAAPHTAMGMLVHLLDIRKHFLAVSATERLVGCRRV